MLEKIQALRKELHRYPELSGQEQDTAKRIRDFITSHNPAKIIENIGGNAMAALYEYPGPGPAVMIRCELDALPIRETNRSEHRSLKEGISHACGHDGHMAIVAGLVLRLREQAFRRGKLLLLFQPAEETGKGAYKVMNNPGFKSLSPDYSFALHNIPGVPLHTIIVTENSFSCTVQSFALHITGKAAHSADPENGNHPAPALGEIISELNRLNKENIQERDFALLTPVYMKMGAKDYGISPGSGELHYTIRTRTDEEMNRLKSHIIQIISNIVKNRKLKYEIDWFDYFPAVDNHPECNEFIINAARKNKFNIEPRTLPFRFGEDFGWFSQNHKAAMFGIGAGVHTPALHQPDYDFPDAIIPTGMDMFMAVLVSLLQ